LDVLAAPSAPLGNWRALALATFFLQAFFL
jgi:hypothetical protein